MDRRTRTPGCASSEGVLAPVVRTHIEDQSRGRPEGRQPPVRHSFAMGGLQAFSDPGCNPIEPQTRLGGVTLASAAPFEGCDVNRNPFPSDHDIGVGRITTLFPRCREPSGDGFDGVRSCFFKSLMRPHPPLSKRWPFSVQNLGSITVRQAFFWIERSLPTGRRE